MKITKSALSKLIQWSTSRYNAQKKGYVIADIIFRVEKGEDCKVEYRSGCYSERAHQWGNVLWTGGEYTLEIKEGVATLFNYTSDVRPSQEIAVVLEKPEKNKYYINATRIYHQIDKWGIPIGCFDVIDQNLATYSVIHDGVIRFIDKKDCNVME